MKKIIFLISVAVFSVALMGCSGNPKSVPATESPTPIAATDDKKVVSSPTPTNTVSPATPAKTITPTKPKVTPPAAPKLVTILGFAFKPSRLIINKGETVKWVNKDGVMHTVTSTAFKSDILNQNDFFSQTFTKPGTYSYKCNFHPDMVGSIIVKQ